MSMIQHSDFAGQLDAWNVLPTTAADAVAAWSAVTSMKIDDPVGPLRVAVQSGEITAKNVVKAVTTAALALTTADKARSVSAELDYPLSIRFAEAVRVGADEIVAGLAGRFAVVAERLKDASAVISLDASPDQILAAGPGAAQAWNEISHSATTLDAIARLRSTLVSQYGYSHDGPAVAAYISAVLDNRHLTAAEYLHRGIERGERLPEIWGGRWRYLVSRGYTLKLNTAAEASAVAAVSPLEPEPLVAA